MSQGEAAQAHCPAGRNVWPKIRIALTIISALTFLLLVAMKFLGMDSMDMPGLMQLIVIFFLMCAWFVIFAVSMVVYAVRKKQFAFLGVAAGILAIRIAVLAGINPSYYFLWMPLEYVAYYLAQHDDSPRSKCLFIAANGAAYALCFTMV